MSWDGYITNLMDGNYVKDAAIVGCEPGQESVWASHPGGDFARITPSEIKRLLLKDRNELFRNGLTLANTKCTVLRDELGDADGLTMDLRTKATDQEPDTFNISVGKSHKAVCLIKGNKEVHGGLLNRKVHGIAEYLKKSGF